MPKPNVTVKFDAAETKEAFAKAVIKKLGWCGQSDYALGYTREDEDTVYEVTTRITEKEILDQLQAEAGVVVGGEPVGTVTRELVVSNGAIERAIIEFTFHKQK